MKTVLIIEDDLLVRESIQDWLEIQGFQVLGAENGSLGIQLAQERLPDIILCDVEMPGANGYDVLTELRHNPLTIGIPFIFLTGRDTKTDFRQGMNLGADDYLTKPCDPQELLTAIASRLEKHQAVQTQTQKQLEDLRSSIALSLPHELRTPLTGILSAVETLRVLADSIDRATALEIADAVQISAERLHRLIQNFLLYARLEVSAHTTDITPSSQIITTENPALLIHQTAHQVAEQRRRSLDLQIELQNVAVAFPEPELRKVLQELVDNAFKFSKSGQSVQISSRITAETYHIQITNQGRGMTAEQIANLGAYIQFDRKFYEQQGTGLGLTIAKRLLESYGGKLTIHSLPDQETTVQTTFLRAVESVE
ncbi:hybrid sensor histidine kinase/response regulator [Pantanalinema sp. GBBB05]|uniref:hybrid sensor histidine kinase/response regulator n=1 Tax=Pantanalinema sp. GBBB05 TaxID=2604139 RepID=UPI001DAC552B|nr:hybrid sensor histidine kinase/response regulator [Pantanalinema sp. GBBB05]